MSVLEMTVEAQEEQIKKLEKALGKRTEGTVFYPSLLQVGSDLLSSSWHHRRWCFSPFSILS